MNIVDNVIRLEKHKDLFRSSEAYEQFIAILSRGCEKGSCVVFSGQNLIGTFLSQTGTRDFLAERFLNRIVEKPQLLEEIAERIGNDSIVD